MTMRGHKKGNFAQMNSNELIIMWARPSSKDVACRFYAFYH